MEPTFILFAVLGVAVFAAIAYYAHLQEKKRREALAAFADEMGWRFSPEPDRTLPDRYPEHRVFRRGHSRVGRNAIRGALAVESEGGDRLELPIEMGDYKYTTGSGKNKRTHNLSYLLIQAPPGTRNSLAIRTENFADKMAAAMGFDDIDFESVEFSDRFHVKSDDKRFAYDVLHPRMMEFLMNSMAPDIELQTGALCLHSSGTRWDPPEFKLRLRWVQQFFALWPRHVVGARR
ncbi:MAG: hypothetical protein AAGJ46_03950 [Planctomycetota bacterium]